MMTVLSDRCLTPYLEDHMIRPAYLEKMKAYGKSYGLSSAGYDIRNGEDTPISAGGFALLVSWERFVMPNNLIAFVHDKSTWARLGLALQNTVIEPGWEGWLTLEATNHSELDVLVHAGEPIAQIVFHQLSSPPLNTYTGKYQMQGRKPQKAIFE